jgi:hypothetical protein
MGRPLLTPAAAPQASSAGITEQPAPIYPLPRGVRENLEAAWLAVEQYQEFISTLDQPEN